MTECYIALLGEILRENDKKSADEFIRTYSSKKIDAKIQNIESFVQLNESFLVDAGFIYYDTVSNISKINEDMDLGPTYDDEDGYLVLIPKSLGRRIDDNMMLVSIHGVADTWENLRKDVIPIGDCLSVGVVKEFRENSDLIIRVPNENDPPIRFGNERQHSEMKAKLKGEGKKFGEASYSDRPFKENDERDEVENILKQMRGMDMDEGTDRAKETFRELKKAVKDDAQLAFKKDQYAKLVRDNEEAFNNINLSELSPSVRNYILQLRDEREHMGQALEEFMGVYESFNMSGMLAFYFKADIYVNAMS